MTSQPPLRQSVWYDDVIKWVHFPRYWSFVRGIHRSPVDSPHKGQWRGAWMFSLLCAWNGWANNRDACDLRHHCAYFDVTVMSFFLHSKYVYVTNMSMMDSPHKWPIMTRFWIIFVVIMNKLLNKQLMCRWFKTLKNYLKLSDLELNPLAVWWLCLHVCMTNIDGHIMHSWFPKLRIETTNEYLIATNKAKHSKFMDYRSSENLYFLKAFS